MVNVLIVDDDKRNVDLKRRLYAEQAKKAGAEDVAYAKLQDLGVQQLKDHSVVLVDLSGKAVHEGKGNGNEYNQFLAMLNTAVREGTNPIVVAFSGAFAHNDEHNPLQIGTCLLDLSQFPALKDKSIVTTSNTNPSAPAITAAIAEAKRRVADKAGIEGSAANDPAKETPWSDRRKGPEEKNPTIRRA